MNLQNLAKIEKESFYFDNALKQTKNVLQANKTKLKNKTKTERIRFLEKEKMRIFSNFITSSLEKIGSAFPSIDQLDRFYYELVDNNLGALRLRQEISKVTGAAKLIRNLEARCLENIRIARNHSDILKSKRMFLGRVGSVLKSLRDNLLFLEKARKELKEFPSIKTKIHTICIAGYPNVGKSTLLRRLTTAKPEINVYPFTTKRLMVGYIGKKLQIIDTPGTFRETESMNFIEKQSYLAIKYLANKIIFVLDITESCGYPLKEQEEMLERIKKEFGDKQILVFASKADLMSEEQIKKYASQKIFFDFKNLRTFLLKR